MIFISSETAGFPENTVLACVFSNALRYLAFGIKRKQVHMDIVEHYNSRSLQ